MMLAPAGARLRSGSGNFRWRLDDGGKCVRDRLRQRGRSHGL